MKTYKVWVSDRVGGYYLIQAESPEQAKNIYYAGETGELHKTDGDEIMEDVEEIE